MEREPLSPENEALWRKLWEMWQDNGEADVILDAPKVKDIEDDIPALSSKVRTSLAYLQRARYIQYRTGVGGEGLEPMIYDVYEPR